MFKFRRLVCLALVCALVGVAYGAAVKIRSFTPFAPEPATADGIGILNYTSPVDDRTLIQIVLNGFTPNTIYDLGIIRPGVDPYTSYAQGECCGIVVGTMAFWTDQHGNATFTGRASLSGDFSSSNIAIYLPFEIQNPDGSTTRAGKLRALGNP
jgi:hypothetical protein